MNKSRLAHWATPPGFFVPWDTYLKPVTVPELLKRLGVADDASVEEQDAAVTEWLATNEPYLHQGLEVDLELSGYRRRQQRRLRKRAATTSSR